MVSLFLPEMLSDSSLSDASPRKIPISHTTHWQLAHLLFQTNDGCFLFEFIFGEVPAVEHPRIGTAFAE
jgi:hypothetical protein